MLIRGLMHKTVSKVIQDIKSYLAGHRCFAECFAEVQEGIKSLLACC